MERMTAAQLNAAPVVKSGVKRVSGAKRTLLGGIMFDSKREANRYGVLSLMEKGGLIFNLERQWKIALHGRDGPILTPTGRQMHYIADFTYEDGVTRELTIEDAKGYATEIYTLKKAILAAMGVKIVEV